MTEVRASRSFGALMGPGPGQEKELVDVEQRLQEVQAESEKNLQGAAPSCALPLLRCRQLARDLGLELQPERSETKRLRHRRRRNAAQPGDNPGATGTHSEHHCQ